MYPVGMRCAFSAPVVCLTLACGSGAPLTGTDSGASESDGTATSATATTASTGPTSSATGTGTTPTEGGMTGMTGGVSETGGLTSTTPTTGGDVSTGGASTSTTGQTDTGTDTSTSTGTQTDPGETGTSTTGDTTTGVMEEMCPCPDLVVGLDDGIFVLSKTAQLWKYFPDKNTLQMLGPVDCGLPPSTFSMGVDRQGYAWVQFSDQQIRKINITDVSDCSDPGFVPGQNGIKNFGMAFVSNSATDPCDRIYGNHYNFKAKGDGVAEFFDIDPVSLGMTQLGKSDFGLAEVTGTGDGRVFLFAGPDPSRLVELDKANGSTLAEIPLPGVKTGGGFAFAFFAGDFYFFTDAESDSTSEVTHLDYDDSDNNGKQDLVVVLQDAPIRIVGAGVSTCAPLVPQ